MGCGADQSRGTSLILGTKTGCMVRPPQTALSRGSAASAPNRARASHDRLQLCRDFACTPGRNRRSPICARIVQHGHLRREHFNAGIAGTRPLCVASVAHRSPRIRGTDAWSSCRHQFWTTSLVGPALRTARRCECWSAGVASVLLLRGGGIPLVVLPRADGKPDAHRGPHNVLIEREDGSRVVRSFRGLRRISSATEDQGEGV
jgi:hypothetical protein